jgi:hypothetical protein
MCKNRFTIYISILDNSQEGENPPAADIGVAIGHQEAIHEINQDSNNNHEIQ